MAYTPELSQLHSGILRRIAWALGLPMTRAIAEMIDYLGRTMEKARICEACRDNSFCGACPFKQNSGGGKPRPDTA